MKDTGKIRILQCIRQGQVGGGESHLLTLVHHLDKSRFEPLVLSFTDGPMIERLQAMGIPVHVIPTTKPFDLSRWSQVRRWVKMQNVQLVHAHGTRAASNVLWASRSLKLPLIYTVHGWSFHRDQPLLVQKLRTWGEQYLTRRSALNISVSESNRQTGLQHFPSFQSVVVPNGIDVHRFETKSSSTSVRSDFQTPDDAVVVLFLARLTKQKQPQALLQAFEIAAGRNEKLFLWMIGDGEMKEEISQRVETSSVRSRIRLQGFRADVAEVLQAADVFVLPSLWEGMPIALLEAMAARKAIVATEVDGTKEVVQHAVNGWLIKCDQLQSQLPDVLLMMAGKPDLRWALAAAAHATVAANFDAVSMTRRTEELYLKTLSQ